MSRIKTAVVALNQTPLDWRGNATHIRAALNDAREQGAELVCLPELCLTGYGCEDAFFSPDTCARAWESLLEMLPETRGMVVAFGLPVFHQHSLYNVAALAVDGTLTGLAAKQNLAGDGIHYEPRWFKPWPSGISDLFHPCTGNPLPIGDLVFDIGGIRIGFEICEDAWVAGRPGSRLAARAIDVILNPSASHFAFGKAEIRKRFVAESPRFSFKNNTLLTATIDPRAGRIAKSRLASHRPALSATADHGHVHHAFPWKSQPADFREKPTHPHLTKEEEFTSAVALGLFDYLRKSRSSGYIVSLSGGADSAAVACLVKLMRDLVLAELGENAGGKIPSADMKQLLLTAYQATENSGETTRRAAHTLANALANALGATHHELDLTDIHRAYLALIATAQGAPLTWESHDIALQNIQARVRAPGIWMFANLRNALLLTTSNRSEAAVGYATMDGDTAGGLAPVSGIDKAFLRHWLRWLETTGPEINGTRHPIPALSVINQQAPSAELRPQDSAQTDEDDLMPYDVLDFIERAAIRDHQSPAEIISLLAARFPQHSPADRLRWTRRFFTLWSRNQWKRERYAPGFHLDDQNLDPKTWCRWPILSGGFSEELNDLKS